MKRIGRFAAIILLASWIFSPGKLFSQTTLFYDDFETTGSLWSFQTKEYFSAFVKWTDWTDPLFAIEGNKSLSVVLSTDSGATWNPGYSENITSEIIASRQVNGIGKYNFSIEFYWKCAGESGYDMGQVGFSLDNGQTYTWLNKGGFKNDGNYHSRTNDTFQQLFLPQDVNNKVFLLAFKWKNDGSVSNFPAFTIDRLTVKYCSTCKPLIDFSASSTHILKNGYIDFTDHSSYFPSSWTWNFPGGTPANSTQQNPRVFYNTPGVYSVTLNAVNSNGTNFLTKTAFIKVDTSFYDDFEDSTLQWFLWTDGINYWSNPYDPSIAINGNRSATISYTDTSNGQTIAGYIDSRTYTEFYREFNTTGLINPYIKFKWKANGGDYYYDFGKFRIYTTQYLDFDKIGKNNDGYFTDQPNDTIQIIYLNDTFENKSFWVTFAWQNDDSINVGTPFTIDDFELRHDPFASPVAAFNVNKSKPIEGSIVTFNDQSIHHPTSWKWEFEDGMPATSHLQNPMVIWGNPGFYKVKLVASNAYGSDSTEMIIEIDSCHGTIVTIITKTDNYGEETWWELTDSYGKTVYDFVSKDDLSNQTEYTNDVCVPSDSQLLFTIHDGWGDGMCCDYGEGFYIVESNCYVIAKGGDFGTHEEVRFKPYPSYDQSGEFEKHFGGDGSQSANVIIETCEGGFAVAGYDDDESAGKKDFMLKKISPKGDLTWIKKYGFNRDDEVFNLKQTLDGGFILAGNKSLSRDKSEVFLLKTDMKGDSAWSLIYGGEGWDEPYDIIVLPGGGFLISCTINNVSALYRISDNGKILWHKEYNFTTAGPLLADGQGNFMMFCVQNYFSNKRLVVSKIDTSGNILWSKYYLWPSYKIRAVKSNDNGFAVFCPALISDTLGNNHNSSLVLKLDKNGNKQWLKEYLDVECNSIINNKNGGYTLLGVDTNVYTNLAPVIYKLSDAGDTLWSKMIGIDEYKSYLVGGHAIIESDDEELVLTGSLAEYGSGNWINHDVFVIRTDSLGNGCFYEPYPYEEICMVTVDPESGKNLVVWNKTAGVYTESFNIYRETAVAGTYEVIGNVPFDSLSVFLDTTSFPDAQSYRYKISTINVCHKESKPSAPHKTMHLNANKGVGGEVNLIWEEYEGFPYSSYKVFRGTKASGLTLIADIPSSIRSFSDINPPAGSLKYLVSVVKPDTCDPLLLRGTNTSGPFSQSLSNLKDFSANANVFLTILPASQTIGKSYGSTATFNVFTNLDSFNAICAEPWIELIINIPGGIVSAQATSSTFENRTAEIVFSAENVVPKSVFVNQGDWTGLFSPDAEKTFEVFPNPFSGSFTSFVTLPEPGSIKIELINSIGDESFVIFEGNQSAGTKQYQCTLPLKFNTSGILFLKITVNEQVYIRKVVSLPK